MATISWKWNLTFWKSAKANQWKKLSPTFLTGNIHQQSGEEWVRYHLHITYKSSDFKPITTLLFLLKSSENWTLADDFSGNTSLWISLLLFKWKTEKEFTFFVFRKNSREAICLNSDKKIKKSMKEAWKTPW